MSGWALKAIDGHVGVSKDHLMVKELYDFMHKKSGTHEHLVFRRRHQSLIKKTKTKNKQQFKKKKNSTVYISVLYYFFPISFIGCIYFIFNTFFLSVFLIILQSTLSFIVNV